MRRLAYLLTLILVFYLPSSAWGADVNVKDFGGVCNGVADDGAAIANAIVAAGVGGSVTFPGLCGTYGRILVSSPITLRGSSLYDGVILLADDTGILVTASGLDESPASVVTIEHMRLVGQSNTHAAIRVDPAQASSFVRIQNVIANGWHECFHLKNASWAHVEHNSCLNSVIGVWTEATTVWSQLTITSNTFHGGFVNSYGAFLQAPGLITFSNNQILTFTTGVQVSPTNVLYGRYVGNDIENCTIGYYFATPAADTIYNQSVLGGNISDCSGPGSLGILTSGATNVHGLSISGLTIKNAETAYDLETCEPCSVSGGTITNGITGILSFGNTNVSGVSMMYMATGISAPKGTVFYCGNLMLGVTTPHSGNVASSCGWYD